MGFGGEFELAAVAVARHFRRLFVDRLFFLGFTFISFLLVGFASEQGYCGAISFIDFLPLDAHVRSEKKQSVKSLTCWFHETDEIYILAENLSVSYFIRFYQNKHKW